MGILSKLTFPLMLLLIKLLLLFIGWLGKAIIPDWGAWFILWEFKGSDEREDGRGCWPLYELKLFLFWAWTESGIGSKLLYYNCWGGIPWLIFILFE